MRYFALLTSAVFLGFAAFAIALPGGDRYKRGVDDGPPQRFSTIADAASAAGYDLPNPGNQAGWELVAAIVDPVYYGRRILAENPELRVQRFPPQQDGNFIYLRGLPDPPPGVHNYVNLTYRSSNGVFISLSMNYPVSDREPAEPASDITDKTKERVRIGQAPASLTTFRSRTLEVMSVDWTVNRVPIKATVFNGGPNQRDRMTHDEVLAFLANVR
jgi:hypothetical protein